MSQFYVLSLLLVVPVMIAIGRTCIKGKYEYVPLQAITFLCCLFHLRFMFREFYLSEESSFPEEYTHIIAMVLMIPTVYMYVCKQFGVSYKSDVALMLIMSSVGFMSRGVMFIGNGVCDVPIDTLPMYKIAIYVNGKLWQISDVANMILLQHVIFVAYKSVNLMYVFRSRHLHLTTHFKQFCVFVGFFITFALSTYMVGAQTWHQKSYSMSVILVTMIFSGAFFTYISMTLDESPVLDEHYKPTVVEEKPTLFAKLAEQFVEMLQSGRIPLSDNTTMDEAARLLGTNRTYIARMMKEQFNTTFAAYMNDRRVDKAKELLVSSAEGTKIQDIAWQSGFSTVSSFNKVFKSRTGVAPGEYKASVK